jgi:hypothetical protein
MCWFNQYLVLFHLQALKHYFPMGIRDTFHIFLPSGCNTMSARNCCHQIPT